LKSLINNKPVVFAKTSFKAFSEKVIADMIEVKRTGNAIVYQQQSISFLLAVIIIRLSLQKSATRF
jgi:hypothetical protein